MKPTKNRYHCPACGRTKMLFESESQALNFIKFNSEELEEENNLAPVRAYYCNMCFGWHVTSKPDAQKYAGYVSKAEVAIQSFARVQELKQNAKQAAEERQIEEFENTGNYFEAARRTCDRYNSFKDDDERAKAYLKRAVSLFEQALKNAIEAGPLPGKDVKVYRGFYNRLCKSYSAINGDIKDLDEVKLLISKIRSASPVIDQKVLEMDNEQSKQEKLRKEQIKMLEAIAHQISIIPYYIEVGNTSEARFQINQATEKLVEVSNYTEIKDKVLEQVNRLMECKLLLESK